MKKLAVSPRGVRLVYLADEGQRLRYGVLRRAHFERLPLSRALDERLRSSACELYRGCADPANVAA
ncbi:MAG: hypothetical protein EXR86_09655 [Gammaproteobacteria bacterium]|nr:hypothetical protein [Gammaproteobacteria bacterium]